MTSLATRDCFASFHISEKQPLFGGLRFDQGLLITGRVSPEQQIWSDLIDDLLGLRSLENDWDGQGAKAPPQDLVDSAIKLACLLRDNQFFPAHYATASVNGTIHFEWVEANRSLDIEVIAPSLAEICAVNLLGDSPPVTSFRW